MLNLLRKDLQKSKNSAPTIDNANIASKSLKENYNSGSKSEEQKNRLEVRIIGGTDQFQEIEIYYGNKKRRIKITKFLPSNLASDYVYKPMANGVGATHLKSLKHAQPNSDLLLKEKLLNVLAKINFLNQDSKTEIDYQKIWDGPQRIAIDQNFLALSDQQKQEMFDKELTKRSPYLSTPEKAILVAAINHLHPTNNKVDRDIISCTFAEIPNQDLFRNFIKEAVALIADKEKLLKNFFVNKIQDITPEKNNNLVKRVSDIFAEADESKRKSKIKSLKKFTDQTIASTFTK